MLKRRFRITSDGATDRGKVRSLNEDNLLLRPDLGIWAVADGMGGHDAGDLASRTLVEELDTLDPATTAPGLLTALEARVMAANARLRTAARDRGADAVIGSTLAVLVIFEDAFACVWSGDSRVYRIRNEYIQQISRDHTEAQDLVDRGTLTPDEARTWPRRNVITRAIGVFDQPELEMTQGRVEDGDIFVLCSDGLTEHVTDDEILARALAQPIDALAQHLIALTLERGARDNVTVIAITCREVTAVHADQARAFGGPA